MYILVHLSDFFYPNTAVECDLKNCKYLWERKKGKNKKHKS